MLARIRKWCKRQGLRFAKFLIEKAQINAGAPVRMSPQEEPVVAEPVANVRGRYRLRTLVSRMPKE